jgi:acyl carrier protein
MTEGGIAKHVMDVVQRRLDVAGGKLEVSTRFVDDLGADSLALVDLTLALEEAFDIEIENDDIERLRTVQEAIDYVERRLALSVRVDSHDVVLSSSSAADGDMSARAADGQLVDVASSLSGRERADKTP